MHNPMARDARLPGQPEERGHQNQQQNVWCNDGDERCQGIALVQRVKEKIDRVFFEFHG